MLILETYGKSRSITATATAQSISMAKSRFCPAIYSMNTLRPFWLWSISGLFVFNPSLSFQGIAVPHLYRNSVAAGVIFVVRVALDPVAVDLVPVTKG